jgi:hypothetical protein
MEKMIFKSKDGEIDLEGLDNARIVTYRKIGSPYPDVYNIGSNVIYAETRNTLEESYVEILEELPPILRIRFNIPRPTRSPGVYTNATQGQVESRYQTWTSSIATTS